MLTSNNTENNNGTLSLPDIFAHKQTNRSLSSALSSQTTAQDSESGGESPFSAKQEQPSQGFSRHVYRLNGEIFQHGFKERARSKKQKFLDELRENERLMARMQAVEDYDEKVNKR